MLGNITNNSNSYDNKRNNTRNNATTKGGIAKMTSSVEQINNSIQSLKRDVERLALQESHEFESIGRGADTINNNEDRIILGKIMEELIVEYSRESNRTRITTKRCAKRRAERVANAMTFADSTFNFVILYSEYCYDSY